MSMDHVDNIVSIDAFQGEYDRKLTDPGYCDVLVVNGSEYSADGVRKGCKCSADGVWKGYKCNGLGSHS